MAKAQISSPKFNMVALFLTADNVNVPVLGNSHYIVLDENAKRVSLFHPFTFTIFSLPESDFKIAQCPCEWNDKLKIADWLEKNAINWAGRHRRAPFKLVREIIAFYRDCPLTAVRDFHVPKTT